MSLSPDQLDQVVGHPVVDSLGVRIGAVLDVFVDSATGDDAWIEVGSAPLGVQHRLAPLADAELDDRGGLHLRFSRDAVRNAPAVDPEAVDDDQLLRLSRHYELSRVAAISPLAGGMSPDDGSPPVHEAELAGPSSGPARSRLQRRTPSNAPAQLHHLLIPEYLQKRNNR